MIPEPSTEEVVMSELHSTPLLLNAVTMADSIFSAVFCELVMAKTLGPEPEIVIL